jgi:two-component system, chemotaxis family, protein-glutamate methylesterase/glutaminase
VKRDIIVIGASAGGVEALALLARTLPSDLAAAIFVVVHVAPWAPSGLPQILSRNGPLPAWHARNHERIEHGRIYVAPPDYHLLLEQDHTFLWKGPKENRFRPAINPLFRSAANSYAERVTGIVLTGALDDGTAGLWSISRQGGVALVQDPDEALVSDMPRSALEHVASAYVARISEMGPLLRRLSMGEELGEEFITWESKRA